MTIPKVEEMNRRGRLMRALERTHLLAVKLEVDDMTPAEARELWGQIERFWVGVCARASERRRDQGWVSLMRKMVLVRRKAQGGQA